MQNRNSGGLSPFLFAQDFQALVEPVVIHGPVGT